MKKLLLSLSLALSLLVPSEAAPKGSSRSVITRSSGLPQQFPVRNAPRRSRRRSYTRSVPQVRPYTTPRQNTATAQSVTVWANHRSYIYHYPGTRWYGVSRNSEYMKESDAIKAGYRAARNGQ